MKEEFIEILKESLEKTKKEYFSSHFTSLRSGLISDMDFLKRLIRILEK